MRMQLQPIGAIARPAYSDWEVTVCMSSICLVLNLPCPQSALSSICLVLNLPCPPPGLATAIKEQVPGTAEYEARHGPTAGHRRAEDIKVGRGQGSDDQRS
jgi:hypothetical protein